jgi:hypothetical protein
MNQILKTENAWFWITRPNIIIIRVSAITCTTCISDSRLNIQQCVRDGLRGKLEYGIARHSKIPCRLRSSFCCKILDYRIPTSFQLLQRYSHVFWVYHIPWPSDWHIRRPVRTIDLSDISYNGPCGGHVTHQRITDTWTDASATRIITVKRDSLHFSLGHYAFRFEDITLKFFGKGWFWWLNIS